MADEKKPEPKVAAANAKVKVKNTSKKKIPTSAGVVAPGEEIVCTVADLRQYNAFLTRV